MDSEAKIVSCLSAASENAELPVLPDAHYRSIIGLGLIEAVATLYPEHDQSAHDRVADAYRDAFLHSDTTPQKLFDGARETVEWLANEGKLLAIATGKSRRGLTSVLDETGMQPLFHATRCADESVSKPAPNMLFELLDELGVLPSRALLVGDTDFDLQMAANAGVHGVAVTSGVHGQDRLEAQKHVACLADVSELRGWLTQ